MRNAVVCALALLALTTAIWLAGCGNFAPTLPSPDQSVGPSTVDIYGRVTRDNGAAPLPGTRVNTSDGVNEWVTQTDQNGNYRLEDVTPGARGVSFAHPDFATEYRTVVVESSDVELNVDMSNPPADVIECP